MRKLALLILSFCVCFYAYTQSLSSAKIETTGNTNSTSFVTVNGTSSVSLDVTDVNKVLVVGTLTSKTISGNSTGSYRICDISDPENINSGNFELTHTSKDGIGTVVYVFDVSGYSGNRTWAFQHCTDAGEISTSCSLTAIALYDGADNLVSGTATLATPLELNSNLETVCSISAIELVSNTQNKGGVYIAASIQNQKTDGGTTISASGQWVLQYKLSSESTWTNLNYFISRSPLGEQKGMVSLVAALPDNIGNGNYDFRVAHQKTAGTATFVTQKCNLVAVSLRTDNGYFPIFSSSKQYANTTSASLTPVLENIIIPQSNTDVFVHAQYAVQANGLTQSTKHDVTLSKSGSIVYDGTDFNKYLHNSSHKCSGSVSALIEDLDLDSIYCLSFRHASASGRNLNTSETFLVCFGLDRSSISFISPVTVNSTEGLKSSSYNTIKEAFDDINSGLFKGRITIMINDNCNESSSCVLNASGTGSSFYNSILIYPTKPNITVSANLSTQLIDFNGSDSIVIDGRVNLIGDASLTISNSSTIASARTIRFYNSSENNTIRYCNIKGSTPATTAGVVFFYTSSAGNGNRNISIESCSFTNAGTRPFNIIYSNGTAGRPNLNITISGCEFFNHFSSSGSSSAIKIAYYSNVWNIDSNQFYDTETIEPLSNYMYCPINITSTDANIYSITNNYIGGSESMCSGSPLKIRSNKPHYFRAIYIRNSGTDLTTISGNHIENIDYLTTNSNPWDGIQIFSGKVLISSNFIGNSTSYGSIKVETPNASFIPQIAGGNLTSVSVVSGGSGYVNPTITISGGGGSGATADATVVDGVITAINVTNAGSAFTSLPNVNVDANYSERATTHGIRLLTNDEVNILGNTIGSFQLIGNDGYAACFEGIYVDEGRNGTKLIANNLFGSETVENSIHCSSSSTNAIVGGRIYGIYYQGAAAAFIRDNMFSNFTNSYNGIKSTSLTTGIYASRGNADIEGNIVHDIKTATGNSGGASSASAFGIGVAYNSSGKIFNVRKNEVYNIINTHPNARVDIYGIYFSASTTDFHEISGNYIHDLMLSTSDINSSVDGIVLYVGKTSCFNNIVHLGKNYTNKHLIFGIWDQASWGCEANIIYNTVLIEGTVESGTIRNSYAFYNRVHSGMPLQIKNNIFVNNRTGGTAGKHYAIRVWGNSNLNIDYNNYYSVSGALGMYANSDKIDLSSWSTSCLGDSHSYNVDPQFAFTGTGYEQFYPTIKQNADNSTGIVFDFIGQERSISSPKIGALENEDYVWTGAVSTDFATAANWESGFVPEAGANVIFSVTASNHCILDINREVGNLSNPSNKNIVVNSKKLTITGNTNFSSTGKINAESAGDVIEYAGANSQILTSNSYTNAQIYKLYVNNSAGLNLSGDVVIQDSLKLLEGLFNINENQITLNGVLHYIDGTLVGGNSSQLIVAGSSQQLILDSITLYMLQLNRSNGLKLLNDITIGNELILTNGILDINGKDLNLNCSLISGTGSLDADDAGSIIKFNNSSALILPATFFADTVSNIYILNSGLTLQANVILSDTLFLNSNNPSSTKGLVDMGNFTLTMCKNAVTQGHGDVTGIVKRTEFTPYTEYTFGNQFTHIVFLPGGTYPDSIKCKISIGAAPSWKSNAIFRVYDFIQNGGNNCFATISSHYLESELNGINEYDLSQWTYGVNGQMPAGDYDWGTANQDFINNRIEIANVNIGYFPIVFGNLENTLASTSLSYTVWDGSESSDWNTAANWNSNSIPDVTSYVLIPSSYNTLNNPLLPLNAEIRSLRIDPNGILNSDVNSTLTVNGNVGAWACYNGSFSPSTGTVVFTNDNASISGSTNFYNLTIGDDANDTLWMSSGSVIRIAGIVTNNGVWRTVISGETTVEYNGANQTIVIPNSATKRYSNLILSGSGTKSMPAQNLAITKNFLIKEETSTTAMASLSIDGDFTICCDASFSTGNFNHLVNGDIIVNGDFNSSSGYSISLNGDSAQSISGDSNIAFSELKINNLRNVYLFDNTTVNSNLDLIAGELVIGENTLSINGNISRTSGKICSCDYCSILFGGTSSITLDNELFCEDPEFYNFTVDRSGGVKLGNQGLSVKNELILNNGTLDINSKSLTLSGNIIKTNGTILCDENGTLCFDQNSQSIQLPNGLFETGTKFSKIIVNRAGDIYLANQNLVVKDTLVLSDGIIYTGGNAIVLFMETAIAESSETLTKGGSQYSFIDGSVQKTGNTSFVFPVGNLDEYAPLSISDADGGGNAVDFFTVRYVKENPSISGYNINIHDASINHVSSSEYWLVDRNGTNNVNLSLSWDERSGGVNEVNDLVVAHWNGTQWEDLGNAGVTGDTTQGTVISNLCSSFSPFTLASKSNKNTLPISLVNFTATCNRSVVSIYWEARSEHNSEFYTIEKSYDGIEWEILSKITSRKSYNLCSYMILDDHISGKGAYYRLMHTDADGQSTIYENEWCDACVDESSSLQYYVYPNPANDFIGITSSEFADDVFLEIFDNSGKTVFKGIIELNQDIDIKDYKDGIYLYRINKTEFGKFTIAR